MFVDERVFVSFHVRIIPQQQHHHHHQQQQQYTVQTAVCFYRNKK